MNPQATKFRLCAIAALSLVLLEVGTLGAANLDVPHIHQVYHTPDEFDGSSACGATSAVMVVAYYGCVPADPIWVSYGGGRSSDYGKYVSRTYTVGGTGFTFDHYTDAGGSMKGYGAWGYIHDNNGFAHADWAKLFFQHHGLTSQVIFSPTESQVRGEIDNGRPVWASTWLTTSGHIVVIRGYDSSGYYINDPWGNPNDASYPNMGTVNSGRNVKVTWSQLRTGEKWIVTAVESSSQVPSMVVKGTGGLTISDGDTTPSTSDGTNFGTIDYVSAPSSPVIFTIENTGTGSLSLTGTPKVHIGGTNASDFAFNNPQPSSPVNPGGSTTFRIVFDPMSDTPGARNATVTIANNDAGHNPYDFAIRGTVSTTRIIDLEGNLAFGNVTVGQTPQRTMTVHNDGNSTLTVSSISYPPGFSGSWSGGTIAADSERDVTVTFSPTTAQSYNGTITVNSNKTDGTDTIPVSGTGTSTPTRIISLSGGLDFGSVTIGSSAQRTLTISNNGNSMLNVSGISYPSGFNGVWSGAIETGNSRDVTVTFTPTSAQSYGGTVTVSSDKTSGTSTIYASGTGTAMPTWIISGMVTFNGSGLSGVTMQGLLGNPTTSGNGAYSVSVSSGFSGAVTPSKSGYSFSPLSRTYSNVTSNQTGQDYAASASNAPPTANPQSLSTPQNTPLAITLTAVDADGPAPLTFAIASQPVSGTLGTLNQALGTVTYTPNAGFNGADSFSFTAADAAVPAGVSASATVSITVGGGGDTTAPTVSISSPSDGQAFTSSSITVSGMAYDSGGSGLRHVIILNATTEQGGWDLNTTGDSSAYNVVEIQLVAGRNDIYAVAFDNAGNQSGVLDAHIIVWFDPPACPDGDEDSDGICNSDDQCPYDPFKATPGVCGCHWSDADRDYDLTPDCADNCPDDPNKIDPGLCGCGMLDTDRDQDWTPDCMDFCPDDPTKTDPGVCGCGVAELDSDGDGVLDCQDWCPNDPDKVFPEVCGCGQSETPGCSVDTPAGRDQPEPDDAADFTPEPARIAPPMCGAGMIDPMLMLGVVGVTMMQVRRRRW